MSPIPALPLWFIWAFLSAIFASASAVFGKVGLVDIDADLATLIRTIVVSIFLPLLIIATGKYFRLKDLIRHAFDFFNLDWRDYIIETNKFKRPKEIRIVKVNTEQTFNKIGWKAKTDGKSVIIRLIKYYLKQK